MNPSAGDARQHLGDAMSRVARQLQEEHGDVEATLQGITASAVATVPNAEECSISYVVGRRKVEPRASTSDLPRQVDELQNRLGQGPCLDAVWEQLVVRVDDVGAEDRWPAFTREASALGIGSMMCFQLFVSGDQLGAMNLYSHTPGAFDDEGLQIGQMFASHAAVALAGAEHEQNLRRAIDSRDLIGQAKGILIERYGLTADQAFGVLARISQETNRRLVDIALELNDTGAVPSGERGPD
ncbi:GAF and ANTAR domain-containing protein [Geodermatophilus maliterrae]|uniref:GAF and ANTAR domain-containing protein n=1 Tax=Geodermatophilus maliterrae TaxID=3162531 RepID=A0ABV3XAW1_9ACTN